nr:ORF28 [Pieris rapae granulovirus]
MHLFKCEYDDLFKFEWPVLLEEDTLILWLDINCLKQKGFELPPNLNTKTFNNTKVTSHSINLNVKKQSLFTESKKILIKNKYEFCEAHILQTLTLSRLNDNYHTVLEQFLYQQLPYYLQCYLNDLKLTSLFDIKNYWDTLANLDNVRKYYLFRLKIVTLQYEKAKHTTKIVEKNVNNVDNNTTNNVDDNTTNVNANTNNVDDNTNNNVDNNANNFDNNANNVDDNVNDVNETNIINKAEFIDKKVSATKKPNKLGFVIDKTDFDKNILCDSIIDNITLQLKHLENYNNINKIHVYLNFNKLLKGSVGLLETLLEWK